MRLASLISVLVALLGWISLIVAAGLAQGNAHDAHIALALAVAGGAGLVSISLGACGLARSASAVAAQIISAVGVLVGTALALVTIVFVVSIHW